MDPFDAFVLLRSKRIAALPQWAREAIQQSTNPLVDAKAAQIVHRIVTCYGGPNGLKHIVCMFQRCEPIEKVAKEFDVTKQRISQWRQALGFVEEKFTPRAVVLEAISRGPRYDSP
jgi:hypothetical protein